MSKRKYIQGTLITNLNELYHADRVIIYDKTYCNGWVQSWQMKMAYNYIRRNCVYHAERLTNAEYYKGLSPKKLQERQIATVCHKCSLVPEISLCDSCFLTWLNKTVT